MHADAATVEAASPAVGHGSRRALALLCSVSSSGPARRRVAGGNIRARGYAFLCSAAPATAAGGGLVVAVAVAVGGEGFGFSGRVSGARGADGVAVDDARCVHCARTVRSTVRARGACAAIASRLAAPARRGGPGAGGICCAGSRWRRVLDRGVARRAQRQMLRDGA